MKNKKFEKLINKLKRWISIYEKKGKLDSALSLIKTCATLLYTANYTYSDEFLEDRLNSISKRIYQPDSIIAADDVIAFYDGFGLDDRGLAKIYILALCKTSKKIIYITDINNKNRINGLLSILSANNQTVCFYDGSSLCNRIKNISDIIVNHHVSKLFFYSMPDDVVGVSVMNVFSGRITIFQVNLTDHAFWLGSKPIDICIEFRIYGASISKEYRAIPYEKLVCIPFYPIIDICKQFEGYPFDWDPSKKVIFSGGALYKTFGDGNKYYKIVDYILRNHKDVIFWYAGSGDDSEFRKLMDIYPNRVFLTPERHDLFQVLQHCYLYLSTYPLCGGLMFQYAAKAGRIPVTLINSNVSDGFLLNQSNLGIEFYNLDDLYNEIDRLIKDEKYHSSKELLISESVISSEHFNKLVNNLVNSNYDLISPSDFYHIDTHDFTRIYIDQLSEKTVNGIIVKRDNIACLKALPLEFMKGVICKVFNI